MESLTSTKAVIDSGNNTDEHNPNSHDLQEMARQWALREYRNKCSPKRKGLAFKRRNMDDLTDVEFLYNWQNVEVHYGKTTLTDSDDNGGLTTVALTRKNFKNESELETKHKCDMTGQTNANLKVTLEKSLTVGSKPIMELSLADILDENCKLSKHIAIDSPRGFEEKIQEKWGAENIVPVSPDSAVTTCLLVRQKSGSAWFNVKVTLTGKVGITVLKEARRERKTLEEFEVNIADIVAHNMEAKLCAQGGEEVDGYFVLRGPSDASSNEDFQVDVVKNEVKFDTVGYFNYTHGVDQEIKTQKIETIVTSLF